jgi:hypothetical protein
MFASADLSESSLIPKDESTFAKNYLQKIYDKDFVYVKNYLDSALINQRIDEKLTEISNYFPTGKLLSTTLIGSQVNIFNSTWQGNFTFEYQFEGGWALANVVIKRIDSKLTVIGFNVYQTKASQKTLNTFSLAHKSVLNYAILTAAAIVPMFILITLVVCIKTPITKRKWLWILFILGGIGTISINWTTGEYGFKILQYQFFGSAATAAGEYAPWIITVGVPLGAIVFWLKRNKFIKETA